MLETVYTYLLGFQIVLWYGKANRQKSFIINVIVSKNRKQDGYCDGSWRVRKPRRLLPILLQIAFTEFFVREEIRKYQDKLIAVYQKLLEDENERKFLKPKFDRSIFLANFNLTLITRLKLFIIY